MTQSVMVSLDGSARDLIALPVATALAELSGADVHLVHVVDAVSRRVTAHAQMLGVDDAVATGHGAAEARMGELATSLAADRHRRVTWDVVESVQVAKALIRHAVERDAVVVVMATRGAGLPARTLVGSVADRVVRECPVPVVVVPPGAAYLQGRRPRFVRILIPLDGSTLGARALDLLLDLPRASSLEYVLIEVVSRAEDRPDAQARLEAAAGRIRARGITSVEVAVLQAGDPVPVIIAALREMLCDAIAMSTRGQSGLRRLVLGSVAQGVVRASEVPVLLITPTSLRNSPRRGEASR
jgi:nucleotide-binding universal stress UspA family protein